MIIDKYLSNICQNKQIFVSANKYLKAEQYFDLDNKYSFARIFRMKALDCAAHICAERKYLCKPYICLRKYIHSAQICCADVCFYAYGLPCGQGLQQALIVRALPLGGGKPLV